MKTVFLFLHIIIKILKYFGKNLTYGIHRHKIGIPVVKELDLYAVRSRMVRQIARESGEWGSMTPSPLPKN